ncbi:MAG: hypothetical protein JSS20_07940 [Proteobacteria bacterium]|nr:hypothetical protein [Pseudomonadota bacterium]
MAYRDGQRLRFLVGFAALWFALVSDATAQTRQPPPALPEFQRVLGLPDAAKSTEQPLPARLVKRLGTVWAASAEPACVSARQLTPGHFERAARAAVVAVGTHLQAELAATLARQRADALFAAKAGPTAVAEMKRLANHPTVNAFLAELRVASGLEKTLLAVTVIERTMLARKIVTKSRADPYATGEDALLQEIERVSAAAGDYAEKRNEPEMVRYYALVLAAGEVVRSATGGSQAAAKPNEVIALIEPVLNAHCIATT